MTRRPVGQTAVALLMVAAVVGCAGTELAAPKQPEAIQTFRTALDVASKDAVAGQTEVVVLHGTKGKSARYVIHGGDVAMDVGDGRQQKYRASPAHVAFLRRVGEQDAKLQALVKRMKPIWAAMGLPDIDSPDDSPGRKRSVVAKAEKRELATRQDEENPCDRLYLELYDETQDLYAAQTTFSWMVGGWDLLGCGASWDFLGGFPSLTCYAAAGGILGQAAYIEGQYAMLWDIAGEIEFWGCITVE